MSEVPEQTGCLGTLLQFLFGVTLLIMAIPILL